MQSTQTRRQYQTLELGKHNQRVVFLFAGWKNRIWMYWLPAKILARNGYYCIVYAYDNDVFSPSTEQTLNSLNTIRDAALQHIATLKAHGYRGFAVFGLSLGTLVALMVANKSADVSKVILNLPGSDPAKAAWGWNLIHPSFKQRLIDQGLTQNELSRIWAPIAPVNNIDNLDRKQILIYLSKLDQIIPYEQGQELAHRIKQAGYDHQLIVSRWLGHLPAAIYNMVNAKVYLAFLRRPPV